MNKMINLTVLELGLRNKQLSTVKCFIKIQIESFRLRWMSIDNGDDNDDATTEWDHILSKLILIINANIYDEKFKNFATIIGRISIETINELLKIISINNVNDSVSFHQLKYHFQSLLLKKMRIIRSSFSVSLKSVSTSLSNDIIKLPDDSTDNIIKKALHTDNLPLIQYLIKTHGNDYFNWSDVLKNAFELSVNAIDSDSDLSIILSNIGMTIDDVRHAIFRSTLNESLRKILVKKLNLFPDDHNAINFIANVKKFHNHILSINWVNAIESDLKDRVILRWLTDNYIDDDYVRENLMHSLNSEKIWNYFIDANEIYKLKSWISNDDAENPIYKFNSIVPVALNKSIQQNMIDSIEEYASLHLKESLLNYLIGYSYSLKDNNDFNSTLYRIGRAKFDDLHHILYSAIRAEPKDHLIMNQLINFTYKLISHCFEFKLYEFLYIYSKSIAYSDLTLILSDMNCPLTQVFHQTIQSANEPSPSNILMLIMGIAKYIYELTQFSNLTVDENIYLSVITFAFAPQNSSIETFLEYSNYKFQNDLNILSSHYPIIYDSIINGNESDYKCNFDHQTVYALLKDSIPFDVSKLFCWQITNNLHNNDDDASFSVFSELPHFSQEKMANLYGLKANLTFSYYISQGRSIEAYLKCLTNRKNSKNIELSCKKAALTAYGHINNQQISTAAMIFNYLLNCDYSVLSLHLSVANLIVTFAPEYLGLNSKQQQSELSDLMKKAKYYSDKRSASKLQQLLSTAISRKYKSFRDIQINECLDWKIAVRFALHHQLDLPIDFLQKCAQFDQWLLFTIFVQIHEYPKNVILNCLYSFNNGVIADHLAKAFQSSHVTLSNKDNDPSNILMRSDKNKGTSARHLRNVLYSRIGLNKSNSTPRGDAHPRTLSKSSVFNDNIDDESYAPSETDLSGAETISVFSGGNTSNSSDGEIPKFDSNTAPKDLFQILGTHGDSNSTKYLLSHSIPLSNPILSLIAVSIHYENEIDIFSHFSTWILAYADFEIRKQFINDHFNPFSWTLEDNKRLLNLFFRRNSRNYFLFKRGLILFGKESSPLMDLFQFLSDFLFEKVYNNVESLKKFQDDLWKFKKIDENIDIMLSMEWIESVSVIALTNSLRIVENSYELLILSRNYYFTRINDTFSVQMQIPDFQKIYRFCDCLSSTNVPFFLNDLLDTPDIIAKYDGEMSNNYSSTIDKTVLILQQNQYFNEAKKFASIAGIKMNESVMNEWIIKAEIPENLNKYEFWIECWSCLVSADPTFSVALKVFKKFIDQIQCSIVKCLVLFKCLYAADKNQYQSIDLEIELWKTVAVVERNDTDNDKLKRKWNILWNEIIKFIKLRKKSETFTHNSNTKQFKVKPILFDAAIRKLLSSGCIDEANRIAIMFEYESQDMDIILACHNIANGKIHNFDEMPLSVQLHNYTTNSSKDLYSIDIPDEQKDLIQLIESITSLVPNSQKACQRILLYFKISCILFQPYSELLEMDELDIVKKLIAASINSSDALMIAKELIGFNDISDKMIASIICNEILNSIRSSLIDTSSIDGSFSGSEANGNNFLSLIRLLNDASFLGHKLLVAANEEHTIVNESLLNIFVIEVYIKSHECFTLACDVNGVALVLRKARFLITQKLINDHNYNSMIRLLTGIGRYSEMTYCFDILKESGQFEMLLSKRMEKVPQLRIALVDYLKGDTEMYPLLALRFCLFREIAESHEASAHKLLSKIELRDSQSLMSYKGTLETVMCEFIDAHESFLKSGCYAHADNCAKFARLIALQIQYLSGGIIILKLNGEELFNFVKNCPHFFEALIVVESYHYNNWTEAIFNNVIIKGDWNYLRDFNSQLELNIELIEDISQRYNSFISVQNFSIDKLTVIRKSMQRLLSFVNNLETKFKLSWHLGFVDATDKLLHDESAALLHDLHRNGYL